MAWRRPGDKPLSEPMMVSLPMHIDALGRSKLKLGLERQETASIGTIQLMNGINP